MELAGIFSDAKKFIPRLRFEDANANLGYFSQPYSEQVALIDALENPEVRTVVVLKPRQIGITTANCAHTWWATFTAQKPLRTIVVADHNKTTKSIFKKFCTYYHHLPRQLKESNPFKINQNDKTLVSQRTDALIDHMVGRISGLLRRSWLSGHIQKRSGLVFDRHYTVAQRVRSLLFLLRTALVTFIMRGYS